MNDHAKTLRKKCGNFGKHRLSVFIVLEWGQHFREGKEQSFTMQNENADKGGHVMKSAAKKVYKGLIFMIFLAVMMLCTILVITFLADPGMMLETIQKTFGLE